MVRRTTRDTAAASEAGSSLPFALLIAAVLVISGAALASRVLFSGTVGASYNQDTRRAREAAEFGIQRIIAELNRERNRMLLAIDPDENGFWSETQADSARAQNPCAAIGASGVAQIPPPRLDTPNRSLIRSGGADDTIDPDAPVIVFVADDGSLTAEADAQRDANRAANVRYAYQLITTPAAESISVAPSDYSGAAPAGQPDAGQLTEDARITIRVRGFSYNNGQLAASTTVEEQIEIVPKPCGRSLANFGNDLRPATEGLGDGGGFLLLSTGAAASTSGSADLSGASLTLESGDSIDPIRCIELSESTCSDSAQVGGGTVDILALPRPNRLSDTENAFPQALEFPEDLGAPPPEPLDIDISSDTPPPSYCKSETNEDIRTLHCLVTQIETPRIVSTTSNFHVKIYFSGEGEKISDPGIIEHVVENGTPPEESVKQLQFFGCRPDPDDGGCIGDSSPTNQQEFRLAATASSGDPPIFFYLPIGTVTVTGSGTFRGILWVRELTADADVAVEVPDTPALAYRLLGVIDETGSGQDKPIWWDFVARSVRRFRLLPG